MNILRVVHGQQGLHAVRIVVLLFVFFAFGEAAVHKELVALRMLH
jgi:hypothetical protein